MSIRRGWWSVLLAQVFWKIAALLILGPIETMMRHEADDQDALLRAMQPGTTFGRGAASNRSTDGH